MWSIQTMINELCELINRVEERDSERLRQYQRELTLSFPQVYWTVTVGSGKLHGELR